MLISLLSPHPLPECPSLSFMQLKSIDRSQLINLRLVGRVKKKNVFTVPSNFKSYQYSFESGRTWVTVLNVSCTSEVINSFHLHIWPKVKKKNILSGFFFFKYHSVQISDMSRPFLRGKKNHQCWLFQVLLIFSQMTYLPHTRFTEIWRKR